MKTLVSVLLMAVTGLFVAGAACGCAILAVGALFIAARPAFEKMTEWRRWLMLTFAGAAAGACAIGVSGVLAAVVISGVIAAGLTAKKECLPALGAAMAFCVASVGVLLPEAAMAGSTLGQMASQIGEFGNSVKSIVPIIGYVAGAGYGGAGLVEVVKSRNGGGQGDFGDGMKKVLIGGGLAGIGGVIDMAAGSMGTVSYS